MDVKTRGREKEKEGIKGGTEDGNGGPRGRKR